MMAPQLMASFTATDRSTWAASANHGAIIVPLLFVLGTVLFVGTILIILVRRYHKTGATGPFARTGGSSSTEFRSGRLFHSSIFHCPNRWVAVKTSKPETVQAALGLHNPTPCSWTDGMAGVSDQKLFISPAIHGWVLVVGT